VFGHAWQTLSVRWERLFDDLEGQYDEAERLEMSAEVADRTRRELARLRLTDRARLAIGSVLNIGLGRAGPLNGQLLAAGPDWLLVRADNGPECLVALSAVDWVAGLSGLAVEPESVGAVQARLDLGYALRRIAQDRSPVTVVLRDGGQLTGTIDRVGADHVDLAVHPLDEPRRPGSVTAVRTVLIAALAMVRQS
jgi:hypothetical protein